MLIVPRLRMGSDSSPLARAKRIYIVEDEALIAMELADRLSQLGYEVCGQEARGEKALEEIPRVRPDLILMDINLAGQRTGIETAAGLRELVDVPVVFLTAFSDSALIERAVAAGAYGYLVKPFEERELHATLQAALYKHQAEQLLRRENERLEEAVQQRTAELQQREAQLRDLFDGTNDLIQSIAPDGRFLYVNRAWRETLGYSAEEVEALNLFQIVHDDCREHCTSFFERLMAGEDVGLLQATLRAKDGRSVLVEGHATVRVEDGKPVATREIFRDVTRRKAAEQALRRSEMRYRTVFVSSADAVMTVSPPSWKFTGANPATLRMFGIASEAEFGTVVPWQISPDYQPDGRPSAELAREMIETTLRDGSHFFEWTHRRMNGEEFPATVLLTRMELDGRPQLQATVRDITAQKKVEAALAKQTVELKEALKEAQESKALVLRNDRLASLGRLSAGLIHEINNPLNYAKQGVLVLRQTPDDLPEECREEFVDTLNDVEDGVARVIQIVSDLRDFTRVTDDTTRIVELKSVVDRSLRFLSHEFKEGDVNIEVDVPEALEVRGDPNHLIQVLVNLVQNALDSVRSKQYEAEVSPWVSVTATSTDDQALLFVRDNGVGIAPDIVDNIFEPFFTTKEVGEGMGIGLAICHRILAEHGGGIEVQSEPGEFCEFVLKFPVEKPNSAGPQEEVVGEPVLTGSLGGKPQLEHQAIVLDGPSQDSRATGAIPRETQS